MNPQPIHLIALAQARQFETEHHFDLRRLAQAAMIATPVSETFKNWGA